MVQNLNKSRVKLKLVKNKLNINLNYISLLYYCITFNAFNRLVLSYLEGLLQ